MCSVANHRLEGTFSGLRSQTIVGIVTRQQAKGIDGHTLSCGIQIVNVVDSPHIKLVGLQVDFRLARNRIAPDNHGMSNRIHGDRVRSGCAYQRGQATIARITGQFFDEPVDSPTLDVQSCRVTLACSQSIILPYEANAFADRSQLGRSCLAARIGYSARRARLITGIDPAGSIKPGRVDLVATARGILPGSKQLASGISQSRLRRRTAVPLTPLPVVEVPIGTQSLPTRVRAWIWLRPPSECVQATVTLELFAANANSVTLLVEAEIPLPLEPVAPKQSSWYHQNAWHRRS